MSFNLQSAICGLRLQSAVCSLQSAVCSLQMSYTDCRLDYCSIYNLQSVVCVCSLLSAVCSLQPAVCSLQSAVCSLQSANVIHRLSVRSLLVYKLKPHKPYASLQETEKKKHIKDNNCSGLPVEMLLLKVIISVRESLETFQPSYASRKGK